VTLGQDKQRVGQPGRRDPPLAQARAYKGKGIKYRGEYIFRKEGKKK
jgi:large subunit ribosomal protein L6